MNKKSLKKAKRNRRINYQPKYVNAILTKLTFWEVTAIFVFLVVTSILTFGIFWVVWRLLPHRRLNLRWLGDLLCVISAADLENDAFLVLLYELTSLVTATLMNLSLTMTLTRLLRGEHLVLRCQQCWGGLVRASAACL